MTPQETIDYCLGKAGAYLDYPFGDNVATAKVGRTENKGGRIFAQVFRLKGKDHLHLIAT